MRVGLHGRMSGTEATVDPQTTTQATPAGTAARLLVLVRALAVIGQELLDCLRDGAGTIHPSRLLFRFQTDMIALIVARVRRGMMIAAALEKRLLRGGRLLGLTRPQTAVRNPAEAGAQSDQRDPTHPSNPTRRRKARYDADADDAALLLGLPSAEDIAERLRRQPIGAVLADLCLDLGINGTHPLWRDLHAAILCHGGNVTHLMDVWRQRMRREWNDQRDTPSAPTAEQPSGEVVEEGGALDGDDAPPPLPPPLSAFSELSPDALPTIQAWFRPPILGTPPPAFRSA